MNKWPHFRSLILLIALSATLYANTLRNEFVYDDKDTVVSNKLIIDFNNLPLLINKKLYFSLSGEDSYRPLVTLTYFIDYALYESKPWGYHFTNLLLHAINGILVYLFLILLFKNTDRRARECIAKSTIPEQGGTKALVASLVFVSHPALTEAVNAVSYREDLMAFLFYTATLILYLLIKLKTAIPSLPHDNQQRHTNILFAISCLFYFLALLSKEMAMSLPLIICCYEWVYSQNKTGLRSIFLNRYNAGYIATTLIYIFFRFYYFRNPMIGEFQLWSFGERLLMLPWLLAGYMKLTLLSISLSADHVIALNSSFPLFLIFSIALYITIFSISYAVRIKEKDIFFGVLFFVIALAPVYNIVPLHNVFAERYLYLPIVGLVIVFAIFITNLLASRQIGKHGKIILTVLLASILSLNSVAVIKRNSIWKDSFVLWTDTIRKTPGSYRAHNNLGSAYYQNGRLKEATDEYVTSLNLKPDQVNAHYNLGLILLKQGKTEDAAREFTAAIRIKPDQAEAHFNLGIISHREGTLSEAIWSYRTAIKLKPDYAEAHNNLGIVYAATGLLEEALQEFATSIKLKPNFADAHYNLGNIYSLMGLKDKAIREFETALRLNPAFLPARQSMESIKNM